MSIPTHFNGSLLNVMGGGGGSSPPAGTPISLVRVSTTGAVERGPPQMAQLYFGSRTTAGSYTSKASFLSDNPGLALQDFTGLAAPASFAVVTSFTGFTPVATVAPGVPNGEMQVWDTNYPPIVGPYPNAVFDSLVSTFTGSPSTVRNCEITFSPTVTAVGFNVARLSNINPYVMTIEWFNGATLLNTITFTQGVNPPLLIDVYTTFAGYGST